MQNQFEFQPTKVNIHNELVTSAKLPHVSEEDEDDLSPSDKPQMHRSTMPARSKDLLPSDDSSPDKRVPQFSNSNVHHKKKDRHSWAGELEEAPEWAFVEEELPNYPTETQTLRVLVVTWNLYGKKPKDGLDKLFNTQKVKHHIISIGTEECLRSIPISTFYESKSYWVNLLRAHLDGEYVMIKSHSMNALHLTVFIHRSIVNNVKGIESAEVRTGIGNIMGNKGGIGITVKAYGNSFLFINCHLASGQRQIKQRNEDFERIMNELELPKARVTEEKKHKLVKQKSTILDRFDYIFWSGDFNYRVNQTRESTIDYIKGNKFEPLLQEDQMSIIKKTTGIFNNFHEGEIKFPPTYKYEVGTQLFDSKKKRTPSWTDRILYRFKNKETKIVQLNYQSLHNVTVSDHRPVFSQFLVTLDHSKNKTEDDAGLVKVKTNYCNVF